MIKRLLAFLLFVLVLTPTALAADVTITCNSDDNECKVTDGNDFLFDETNIYPGFSVTKEFELENEDDDDICEAELELENLEESIEGFAKLLQIEIKHGSDTIYGPAKSINDLFKDGSLDLDEINPDDSETFEWHVTFDINAGNEFQSKEVTFDFDLSFTCDHEEEEEVVGAADFFPEILGIGGPVAPPEEEPPEEPGGEVRGITEIIEACNPTFLMWLILGLQVILHFIVHKTGKLSKSLLQTLLLLIFAAVFYKFFCPTWGILASLGMSGIALILASFDDR